MRNLRFIIVITILLSTTLSGASEPITFKDWSVNAAEGYIYAATVNSNLNVLGQYCYYKSKTCYYILGLDAASEDGQKYPALINSDKGSSSIVLIGGGKMDSPLGYRYYITYDDVNNIVLTSNRVGFALPMESDNFKAVRFSLDGARDAIKFMLKVFNSSTKDNENTNKEKKDSETF